MQDERILKLSGFVNCLFCLIISATFSGIFHYNAYADDAQLSSRDVPQISSQQMNRIARRRDVRRRRKRPYIKSYSLINSKGRRIKGFGRIKNGRVLKLSKLGSSQVFIRANVVYKTTKSVNLELSADGKRIETTRVDLKRPYRARKSKRAEGAYREWTPTAGEYTISGTPYKLPNNSGAEGTARSVTFTVIDDQSTPPGVTPPPGQPGGSYPPTLKVPSNGTPQWTTNAAVIYKDGTPYFPFGFYHISHYSHQKKQRLKDLQKIADAGFNMVNIPVDYWDEELLDLCHSIGIDVAMEFNGVPEDLLGMFGTHPALGFLSTFDDVDQYSSPGKQRYAPKHVQNRSAELKALAPHTLSYISGGWPSRIMKYAGRSDLIAQQGYPIPFETLSSLTHVYMDNIAQGIGAHGQGFIANLQTFDWGGSNSRIPTRREVRNMTYQSLILGAHGIIYYTFYDSGNSLNNHPKLWNELTALTGEIAALKEVLLFGNRIPLSTGDSYVFAARWTLNNMLYVIVANAHQSKSKTVNLNLPPLNGPASALFSDREASLTVNGGALKGTLAAEDVQIYSIPLQ